MRIALWVFCAGLLVAASPARAANAVWLFCGETSGAAKPCGDSTTPLVTTPGVPLAGTGVANQASADSVSNFVFTAANKQLFSLTVKIGATSGYVMIFDAASLPANGAVTPKWCYPVASDGTKGAVSAIWSIPVSFTTGITAGFSTTGCDSLTASATSKIMGQAN